MTTRKERKRQARRAQKAREQAATTVPKPSNTPATQPQAQQPDHSKSPQSWVSRFWGAFWKVVVAVGVVAGLLGVAYQFRSRVSLSFGERLDPANALSYQSIVSNDGLLSLYEVEINCTGGHVRYANGLTFLLEDGAVMTRPGYSTHELGPAQKLTAPFICHAPTVGDTPASFDFVVEVHYNAIFLSRGVARFRVVSDRRPDGMLVPMQMPIAAK